MSDTAQTRVVDLLLVEDNPEHLQSVVSAFDESEARHSLRVANGAGEAVRFLRSGQRKPDVILMDLNVSSKDGRDALAEIKNDPELRRIPVVVLTNSSAPKDVREAYRLNCNCFIIKPADLERLADIVRSIREFWFETVRLPSSGG